MQASNARSSRTLLLVIVAAVILATGCAPPPSADGDTPALNKEVIDDRINDSGVYDVPPENGQGKEIWWRFARNEPKEITVVEQQIEGTKATIILDINTHGNMGKAKTVRYLSGRLRTEWELKSNLVFRRWEIVWTENISMKYKDVPNPESANANAVDETPPEPPKKP